MTNLCEWFCSTHIASQLGSDWWVKKVIIKFVWVQMTNFSDSSLSTQTLSLWNSGFWVILVTLSSRWLRTGHIALKRRQFDVDIMSIRRKENTDKLKRHFDVLFQCNFDGQKIDVVSTYFVGITSMREISTSFDLISVDGKSMLFRFIF